MTSSQEFSGSGGSSNVITLPNIIDPNSGPGSMVIWVNCSTTGSNATFLSSNSGMGSTGRTWILTRSAADYGTFIGVSLLSGGSQAPDQNNWVFLGCSWSSGGSGTVQLLRNSVVLNSATLDPDNNSNTMNIGRNHSSTQLTTGKIAHLHIYNRVISMDEMTQISYGPGTRVSGLLGYWPLWDSSDTQRDLSGNGNNGTRDPSGEVTDNSDGPI
ncbi:MAG: LamG-like jellyroll fold domain-containing protein [Nitrosopumilaceae archaeon]|nr:LamG-like jellyroll fold domain-containing protein [Nitrosopumilaceae archaeon]